MFRTEFLDTVWNIGRVEAEELAILLNTTIDLIMSEAHYCAEQGLVRMLDSVIFATPSTNTLKAG